MEQTVREYLRVSSLALLSLEGGAIADFEQAIDTTESSALIARFVNADISAIFVDASGGED